MTTRRSGYTITETDDVARALEAAAQRWPEDREARGRLLLRLVHEGHVALPGAQSDRAERRREVIEATAVR